MKKLSSVSKFVLGILVCLSVVVFVGCAPTPAEEPATPAEAPAEEPATPAEAPAEEPAEEPVPAVEPETPATPATEETGEYIGEDAAKIVALQHAGLDENDVTFAMVRLDTDDGIAEYEVEFFSGTTEYDYDINAVTGEIIGYDYDAENTDLPSDSAQSQSDFIGEDEAKSVALEHAGFSESEVDYIRVKLDHDDGIDEYEVEFSVGTTEYEYAIAATDGRILESDMDND